jgi:hypothetical protein
MIFIYMFVPMDTTALLLAGVSLFPVFLIKFPPMRPFMTADISGIGLSRSTAGQRSISPGIAPFCEKQGLAPDQSGEPPKRHC